MEYLRSVGDVYRGICSGEVDPQLSETEESNYVMCDFMWIELFVENSNQTNQQEAKLQRVSLFCHPRFHIKRTFLLRLQPALDTMGMESVITLTPSNLDKN